MRVRDYFISNPCHNTPISIPCIPCKQVTLQTHTLSGFDYDCFAVYTDLQPYEFIDPEDAQSIPYVTYQNNSILINILESVEKHPDLPVYLLKQLIEDYHIGGIQLGHGFSYIPVIRLQEELHNLYLLFICYRILVWGEKLNDMSPQWPTRLRKMVERASGITTSDRELCTSFLTLMIQSGISCNTVFSITDEGNLQRMYECETVDDALQYQLFLHIEAGESGLNGYTLARCKRCGTMYPQATRKFSLCEHCREPRERTRACREKKKEALNAQETHP